MVWATRIGGRYMGMENADAYGRRNAVPGELLVRLRPAHVVAHAAIADSATRRGVPRELDPAVSRCR